jgi:hypothetical protein
MGGDESGGEVKLDMSLRLGEEEGKARGRREEGEEKARGAEERKIKTGSSFKI